MCPRAGPVVVTTFAPDNVWFIATMNAVFEQGGSLVRREVAHNLMRLTAECKYA